MNTRLDAKAALDKVIRKGRIHYKVSTTDGETLLSNLALEFVQEFPILNQLEAFLAERDYRSENLQEEFVI